MATGLMKTQYNYVLGSREIMLNHCAQMLPEKFAEQMKEFKMNSICMLLVHSANAYLYWIGKFGLGKDLKYFADRKDYSAEDIKSMYTVVDSLVAEFTEKYEANPEAMIEGYNSIAEGNVSYPALQVFLHAVTHEYHHKGQIMSVSSLIGYPPPDADVIHYNDH
jgi:uncharacterized damage-inducible protein DinB